MEWKKKDGTLDETSGQRQMSNRWLHFDSITLEDDGEYECRAFNIHGSTTHSFTVSVEGNTQPHMHTYPHSNTHRNTVSCMIVCVVFAAAPYWVKEPSNLLYAPGETVRLECQAEGIPTPAVTWSINGVAVTGAAVCGVHCVLLECVCVCVRTHHSDCSSSLT